MLNIPLYKRGIKENWKMLLVLAAVLTMYFTIIITMFDPTFGNALDELAKAMPELMAIVGMTPTGTSLIGFLSAYLYGFIMLVFPMIFSILCANRLVAQKVDRGSMSYLLAAPVKRSTVAFTQMKVLASGLLVLIVYAALVGIVSSEAFFPGELEIGKFLLINAGVLCLHLFIGGICLLCACLFSEPKYSIGVGAGIPALAFIIQMLSNAGEGLEKAKYATFFSLFHADGLIAGDPAALWGMAALFVGALLLFAAAILVFSKKDLHI